MTEQTASNQNNTTHRKEAAPQKGLPVAEGQTTSTSEFYERLKRDDSEVAQTAVSMMDELAFTIEPDVKAFYGSFLYRLFVLPLILLLPIFVVVMILGGMFTMATMEPQAAVTQGPLLSGLVAVVLAVVIALGNVLIRYLSAKNTRYTFENGVLRIQSGGLKTQVKVIEIFRVEEIAVDQDWGSKRADLADLRLTVNRKGGGQETLSLMGVGPLPQTEQYAARLRELVVTLRSIPWLKGFLT
jgi:membrane protein YdbS with pleckstrin-like domain